MVVVLPTTNKSTPPLSAQDDQRAYGEVWPFVVLPVLPAGIRFWVRVEAPAEQVQSLAVNVWQNDKLLGSQQLDPLNDIMFGYEDAVEYEYFLDVQAQTAFRMFDPIKLTLSVTLVDGTTNTHISTVVPQHQGYGPWQNTIADTRLEIYMSNPTFGLERVANELLPTFDLLAESLPEVQPLKLAVYMPPINPFCDLLEDEEAGTVESVVLSERRNFPCSEDAMAELYARSGLTIVKVTSTGYSDVRAELAGTIATLQYAEQWDTADIPAWFRAGFAMYFAPNGRPEALSRLQRAAQRDDLLRLPALNEAPAPEQQDLWEAQAFLLTIYLADLYGADAPQQIAAQLSPSNSFESILREQYNTTSDRLYGAWVIWLDSSRAIEVAAFHPYLENTPTPTPIPSVTPTRTPTLTPLPTATPTQRPFSLPTNPPIIGRGLPTFTPTATITPLPPGFFDRITPTPPPAQTSSEGNSQLCNTGLGTLMIPLLAFIVGRKRRVRH